MNTEKIKQKMVNANSLAGKLLWKPIAEGDTQMGYTNETSLLI